MTELLPRRRNGDSAVPGIDELDLELLLAELALYASENEQRRHAPHDSIELIRQSRLGALRVPRELGGSAGTMEQLLSLAIALGQADPNVAHILRNHYVLVEFLIQEPASTRRDRILADVVNGKILSGLATEPTAKVAGAPEFSTTLHRVEGCYELHGEKHYSTGALYADILVIAAVTDDGRIASATVPADRTGIIHEDDWDGFGQRLTGSGTTRLHGVRVHEAEVVLGPNHFEQAATNYRGGLSQLWLTAVVAGISRAVVSDAAQMVRARKRTYYHASASQPTSDPLLQLVIGQLSANAYAAETLVLDAARRLGQATALGVEDAEHLAIAIDASLAISRAKVIADELAQQSATKLFDVGGASATSQRTNLDRHWRNVRTLASHNPTIYKARVIGDYEINGTAPPEMGYF